jgi:hypothetical protein
VHNDRPFVVSGVRPDPELQPGCRLLSDLFSIMIPCVLARLAERATLLHACRNSRYVYLPFAGQLKDRQRKEIHTADVDALAALWCACKE